MAHINNYQFSPLTQLQQWVMVRIRWCNAHLSWSLVTTGVSGCLRLEAIWSLSVAGGYNSWRSERWSHSTLLSWQIVTWNLLKTSQGWILNCRHKILICSRQQISWRLPSKHCSAETQLKGISPCLQLTVSSTVI